MMAEQTEVKNTGLLHAKPRLCVLSFAMSLFFAQTAYKESKFITIPVFYISFLRKFKYYVIYSLKNAPKFLLSDNYNKLDY